MVSVPSVKAKDTLDKIIKNFYGDSSFVKKFGDNRIFNSDQNLVGQTIKMPSKYELEDTTPKSHIRNLELNPPHGLKQILATFGNIHDYIRNDGTIDPTWEIDHLVHVVLPFPIPLSWDQSKNVTRLYCHKKLSEIFHEVFATIKREGLKNEIKTFGGCFNFRRTRKSGEFSTHSWGIAIDLNPLTNLPGRPGDMNAKIVDIFSEFSFKWGGNWSGDKMDPMHFQFCTGY